MIINKGSRNKLWKKGRLCRLVSPWILISVSESNEKPVILSPQLISSAAIKKDKALRNNQINESIEFLLLLFQKIKIPNIDEKNKQKIVATPKDHLLVSKSQTK